MRIPAISFLLTLLLLSDLRAAEPMKAKEAFEKHLFVTRESPVYPSALERLGVRGDGVFEMEFDYESGRVRDVRILRSTGNLVLDRNAVIALKHWRAKPRSIHTLQLPLSFGVPPQ
jgi:TonB family protein